MTTYLADLHLHFPTLGDGGLIHEGIPLLNGWLPWCIQIIVVAALSYTMSKRSQRWYLIMLPSAVFLGILGTFLVNKYLHYSGNINDHVPIDVWIWSAIFGISLLVLILGWMDSHWTRKITSIVATVAALLSIGLALNYWLGYYPTINQAISDLTSDPLPDEIKSEDLPKYEGKGATMQHGVVVKFYSPDDISGFKHRDEYIYLPPAYFYPHKPSLPVLLMIGGEFNSPEDWIINGGAVEIADDYAKDHHGQAPILGFVDVSGDFNTDSECVDGVRGNAATHINQEFRPYVIRHFRASSHPISWAGIGWSMGGTCALSLAVTHPELYGTYVNILGDDKPSSGDEQQSLERLYNGDAALRDKFDTYTQLQVHRGEYTHSFGLNFTNKVDPEAVKRFQKYLETHNEERKDPGFGGKDDALVSPNLIDGIRKLCDESHKSGFSCAYRVIKEGHNWQIGQYEFYRTLPWIGTRFQLPYAGKHNIPQD